MQDVRAGEVDEAVAIGVSGWYEERSHLLTVEMESHRLGVRHDRPSAFRRLREEHAPASWDPELLEHPQAHVVVREDEHTQFREILVAADVIRVDMRVDQETDLGVRDRGHCRDDAVGDGRELVVHEQHAVRPHEHADVPAGRRSLEHVDVAGDVDGLERWWGLLGN